MGVHNQGLKLSFNMASNYPTDTEDEWNEGEPEFQLSPPPSQKIVSNFNPVGELQSEFAKLPIDRRELLDCKRSLDKMPQSKYEEDSFQLQSRTMSRGDLPSVVEMIESTFFPFLKTEQQQKSFKVKAKSILLTGDFQKPRFAFKSFHEGVGTYIDGYAMVVSHEDETCDLFCALFGIQIGFGKHKSKETKSGFKLPFYEPKKTVDTKEMNFMMDSYLRHKSLKYFADQGLIQAVPFVGELTEEEEAELRPVTGIPQPAPRAIGVRRHQSIA